MEVRDQQTQGMKAAGKLAMGTSNLARSFGKCGQRTLLFPSAGSQLDIQHGIAPSSAALFHPADGVDHGWPVSTSHESRGSNYCSFIAS